jgi:hypothetical protein
MLTWGQCADFGAVPFPIAAPVYLSDALSILARV